MGHRNGSGLGELPVSGHASNSDQHPERAFFPNLLAQTTHFQNLGVSQQPLASVFYARHCVSLERVSFLDQLGHTLRIRTFDVGQSL